MNDNAYKGYSADDDRVDHDDDLFDDLERIERDADLASDASLLHTDAPRLSLVRADDVDDLQEEGPEGCIPSYLTDELTSREDNLLDEDYGELWLADTEAAGSDPLSSESRRAMTHESSGIGFSESFDLDHELHGLRGLDQSAVEDIVLTNPIVTTTAEPDSTTTEESFTPQATAAAFQPGSFRRGKSVAPKMNWKPGDPFGGDGDPSDRFRWELMLTTACITAVCGMGGLWLLRTILA